MDAVKKIGLPCTELFIDGVDFEYGMRFKKAGFHNFVIPQSVLYHNFGQPKKVRFLFKEKVLQIYSPLRHYYICRNHSYLEIKYVSGRYAINTFLFRLKFLIKSVIDIALFDQEDKLVKIWACFLGTWHGFQGKIGKNWRN